MSHLERMVHPEENLFSAPKSTCDPVVSTAIPSPPCNPTPNPNLTRCLPPGRRQPMANPKKREPLVIDIRPEGPRLLIGIDESGYYCASEITGGPFRTIKKLHHAACAYFSRRNLYLPPPPSPQCEEHVGGIAQPASAQTLQQPADSFSEQVLVKIDHEDKSPVEILMQEKDLDLYRSNWKLSWGGKFGSFDDYTCMRAMLFTHRPAPAYAGVRTCLQIFSIQVMPTKPGLEWPLEIYGLIATRDSVDHNRNILFRRERGDCQILSEKDSYLLLTGPSRAVVYIDPVDFEIQLKVKGRTESEDKDLVTRVLAHGCEFGNNFGVGKLARSSCSSKLCTLEFTSALLPQALEATILSAEVIQGPWPKNVGLRIRSGTGSINEDFMLLDSGDGRMHVDSDGRIALSRSVVCVEQDGILILQVDAYSKNDDPYAKSFAAVLKPKKSHTSVGRCKLPFCMVQFTVGWSLIAKYCDVLSDDV